MRTFLILFESMPKTLAPLPRDRRLAQGGLLFLASLLIFFVAAIVLFGMYAYWRRESWDKETMLPRELLWSTVSLVLLSLSAHWSTKTVRRDLRRQTSALLIANVLLGIVFTGSQWFAMQKMLESRSEEGAMSQGIGGMVVVLAIIHGLHVLGGIMGSIVVAFRSLMGKYDHEHFWAVNFMALYWHFLDLVWLFMLAVFWCTSQGF